MEKETRQLIEQAFAQLHEASQDENNQMTDAGRLMYGVCLALLDLDNNKKDKDINDGFNFI